MAFTSITVTHQFKNPDGSPASGVIAFRLNQRMTNSGVTYAETVPVHATLDATGRISQALPANDDLGTTPSGASYIVTFFLNSAQLSGDEVSVVVPHDAPAGTVDLGTLMPQQEGA